MKISTRLSPFQRSLQEHLVEWKWKHIGTDQGKSGDHWYDSILSDKDAVLMPHIYAPIRTRMIDHQKQFQFKFHRHFNHMASSQAAAINLFLPIMASSHVETILRSVKPDFNRLAIEYLDKGWQIEYYDGFGKEGVLYDKNHHTGTDADIGIAYYNHEDELCLWLIEHKLTEKEFTTCGGAVSKGRSEKHDCDCSLDEIIDNKDLCYYHSSCGYRYWEITAEHRSIFSGECSTSVCPFKGGMNQLWRNMILALGIEQRSQPFVHASFSVVHHPANPHLEATIQAFRDLTNNTQKFSVFTSDKLVTAAQATGDSDLIAWADWYHDLYFV